MLTHRPDRTLATIVPHDGYISRPASERTLRHADDISSAPSRAVAMRRRHVRLDQALTALFTPSTRQ